MNPVTAREGERRGSVRSDKRVRSNNGVRGDRDKVQDNRKVEAHKTT